MANFYAQYPPSGTTTIIGSADVNIHDSAGNALTSTAGALNVSGTFSNPSVGTNGAATPASSTLAGGSDGTNLRALKVSATGVLSVDGSASTQPVSGTVNANTRDGAGNLLTSQANGGQRALDVGIDVAGVQIDPRDIRSLDSVSDSIEVFQATGSNLNVAVSNFPGTQPVSGTVTVVQPTGTNLHAVIDSGAVAATQSGTWNINNISGTVSLPTGAATEATLATLSLSQGSTTSGEKGPLIQGAVTTAAPSYTTAQTSPLSLTTAGALRTDSSGSTQPVSGTVTANQGTSPWVVSGTVTANAGTNLNTSALALDASVIETHGTKAAGTAATKSELIGGVFNTSLPTPTNGQQNALQLDTYGRIETGVASTGSGSAAAATVSTVVTLSAPSGSTGFVLMNLDTSTANVRWAVGRTASTTLGQQLQPGRDTGFVHCSGSISVCAESGTQNIDVQFFSH